jgi:hypothetical protein
VPRREDRLSDGSDTGQDEVDAGPELLAVVVPGELRRHPTHERVLRGVELRPPCGDGREEGRPVRLAREEAGARGVLSGEAENVVQERGRAVELRSSGDAERLELPAEALEDLQHRGLPRRGQPRRERAEGQSALAVGVEDLDRGLDDSLLRERVRAPS